MFKNR